MNKIKFAFLLNLCFLFSFFYSCKKEEQTTTTPAGSASLNCLPDIIKDTHDSIVSKYFFDNQKRIYRIEHYGNGAYYGATHYYYTDSAVEVTDSTSIPSSYFKYGLNAQGYPKYLVRPSSDPNFFDSTFYFYDTENHIIQENDTSYYFGSVYNYDITTHQIVNGNRVYSLTNYFTSVGNFIRTDTAYYEYYLDKQNIFDFEFGLKGKKNTNLLKHEYKIYNAGLTWISDDFNYDLGSGNYIKRRGERFIIFQGGAIFYNDTSNVTIHYYCN